MKRNVSNFYTELESILDNIKYIDYELIFVNDNSTDNSLNFCKCKKK